jgi:hypothetical protein
MVFLVLLIVPLLVAAGGYVFSKGLVTKKELALQVGVQLVVAGIAAYLVHLSSVHDVEVWNGVVTQKRSEHVSCSHSYSCNCRKSCTGSGKNESCSETCDTCYDHPYDVDWHVFTSNGETVTIERVDRQGTTEPRRWTAVVVGEPTTIEHSYTNYIKAAPDTLFRHQGLMQKFAANIPKYPRVQDYYRINRIVSVNGAQVSDFRLWNDALSKLNAEVGRPKQANIIVIFARNLPQEYFYALEEAWVGAKKNDIVVVIGTGDDLTPQWTTVMCWTTQEMFKVKLRDDIMASKEALTLDRLMGVIRSDVTQYFVRKPMADFQYLEASITPTVGQWAVSLLVCLVIQVILTIVCIKNDLFGEERFTRRKDLYSMLGIGYQPPKYGRKL